MALNVFALLNHSPLIDLVGASGSLGGGFSDGFSDGFDIVVGSSGVPRIFPVIGREGAVRPCVIWSLRREVQRSLVGVEVTEWRLQVDCLSRQFEEASAIGAVVKSVLDGFVDDCYFAADVEGYTYTVVYRIILPE